VTLDGALHNLLAYSLQVGLLAAAAGLLPFPLRVRDPRILLNLWRAVLLISLFLPLLQPWRESVVAPPVASSPAPASAIPSAPGGPIPIGAAAAFPWAEAIAAVLAAGILLRLVWLLGGLLRLRAYRRRARPLHPIPDSVERMCRRLDVRPEFLICAGAPGPVAFGFLRPVVLFHEGFETLDESRREALACHELVHLRRRDWLWTVFEELVRAVLWFHPAVWWLVERVRTAREQVVDRRVVALTRSRPAYLEALLHVASLRVPERPIPAPLFLRERQLVRRVALMLEEVSMSKVRLAVSLTTMVFVVAGGVVAAVHAFPLGAGAQMDSAASSGEPGAAAEEESFPRLVHAVEPVYPEAARRAGVSGLVILEATVDESGEVAGVHPIRANPMLVPPAVEAVRLSRWEPRRVDGKPVSAVVPVRLVFPRGGTPFWESPSPDGARPDEEEEETDDGVSAVAPESRADWS
jgi:TonB family protein